MNLAPTKTDVSLGANLLRVLAVGVAYYLAARLGLKLALVKSNITPVFPPTGIAVVALFAFGYRVCPGIAAAAFFVNAPISPSVWTAVVIAVGNTAAPLAATYILNRVGFQPQMERLKDSLAIVFGALASMTISATVGAAALVISGVLRIYEFPQSWAVWWVGDAMGVLVVAPIIFMLMSIHVPKKFSIARAAEAVALYLCLVLVTRLAFMGELQLMYLCFPLAVWAAWRFQQKGAIPAVLIVSILAIGAALAQRGPFVGLSMLESMLTLQIFTGSLALTSYILAAATSERIRAREILERMRVELEEGIRQGNAQLAESTGRLEEAQEIANVGSWEWDIVSDKITWSNELFRIYGLDPQEFEATYQAFLELIHPEDKSLVNDTVQRAFADRAPFEFDHRIIRLDGQIRTLHARGTVIVGEDGRPARMVGTGQDVSELHLAEQTLQASYEREHAAAEHLRELDEMKNSFLSAISHELRTPLTSVLGFAKTLERQAPVLAHDEVQEMAGRISVNAERLRSMLINLLDLDRISRGVLEPKREWTDIGALIDRTVASLETPGHFVVVESKDFGVWVDPAQVERIIENLVVNASRYTPSGTTISVKAWPEGDGMGLAIGDEGPGITDEFKEVIFQAFRQGGGAHAVGSGLGLSLVAQFAKLHSGRAWVEDKPGGGSSFMVHLGGPVAPIAPYLEASPRKGLYVRP